MLRLMAWNFLEGGFSPLNALGQRLPNEVRRTAARELVARLDPDVLILNEALCGERGAATHQDYGRLFEREHVFARSYDDAKVWGNAIVSRRPFLDTVHLLIHRSGDQNRGMMAAQVATELGPLWITTYHPHPWRRPEKRAEDIAEFLRELPGPALLAGDLNAVHPLDTIDVAGLIATHERFQTPGQALRSVARFQDAGRLLFNETLPSMDWRGVSMDGISMPTALIRQPGDNGMRIDHLLVSPQVVVQNARIEHAPEADLASDHYPIVAEVGVRAKTTDRDKDGTGGGSTPRYRCRRTFDGAHGSYAL